MKQKANILIPVLTVLLLIVWGCAENQKPKPIKIPSGAAKMEVAFSWAGIAACGHDSPEIQVSGIPSGTEVLEVHLKDLSLPEWNQGGGSVKNDGSGIIPAGALKIGYNGPCPPPDNRHKYEFSVLAKDAQGAIIGFGKARQVFPPKP